MINWITNNPQAASALKAADSAYEAAVVRAMELPLARKIEALRAAKDARQAAYDAVYNNGSNWS